MAEVKMKKISRITFCLIVMTFFSHCVNDSVVKNLTIVNKTSNPIVFSLVKDSTEGNHIYFFVKNEEYDSMIKHDYVVYPNKEVSLISNGNRDYLGEKDTNHYLLYIIDIKKLDSLKKIIRDTVLLKSSVLRIHAYTSREFKTLNWKVTITNK
jgi:hypothetical protein